MKTFFVSVKITSNATGRSIIKSIELKATTADDAKAMALDYMVGGNESGIALSATALWTSAV